ncbi:MAG: exosortase-associated EpsI family protein [Phycisphaerales bacterium]|nr:exosortase-associated EpsI family protein [Phycisphaerales bacterium]
MRLPRRGHFFQRIPVVAPACTFVLLILLGWKLPAHVRIQEEVEARKEKIRQTLAAVPFRIGGGRWNGIDQPIPPDAQRLLRFNGALSRRYRGTNGLSATFLLVHCGDSRDMLGHYPPICYPANGWVTTDLGLNEREQIAIQTPNGAIPVFVYQFRRRISDGTEQRVRIFDTFILPNGGVTPHIGEINELSGRYELAVQGVAQLQILTPAEISEDVAIQTAEELLAGMPMLLSDLGIKNESSVYVEGASHEE